jgi:serine/threonine protein kinase
MNGTLYIEKEVPYILYIFLKERKEASMTSRVGQQFGNYRLTQRVGAGGFAEVYVGEHIHLGTLAAIKVLYTQLGDASAVESFRKEARIIAQLVHPNIVRVLEFGVDHAVPFLAMDYAPHGSLQQTYRAGIRVPLETVVIHTKQIAAALQHAHDNKIIHRDIKPANMIIGRQKEILVSDFGIAIATQSTHNQARQEMAGTVAYMAPEQIQSHARPASDQYSLATLVYEGLCGRRPFEGTFTEIAVKQVTVQPPPPHTLISIAPAVENVILKALAKDRTQRFPKISDFAQALEYAASSTTAINSMETITLRRTPGLSVTSIDAIVQLPFPSGQPVQSPDLSERTIPITPSPIQIPSSTIDSPQTSIPLMTSSTLLPTSLSTSLPSSNPRVTPVTPLPSSEPLKNKKPQPFTSYPIFSIPSFFLTGTYIILMIFTLLPIFITDLSGIVQLLKDPMHMHLEQPASLYFMIWLIVLLPLEILMAGILLGAWRGFFAITVYVIFLSSLLFVLKMPVQAFLALYLITAMIPLVIGWLYSSRPTNGCFMVGLRILLGIFLITTSVVLLTVLLQIVHNPAVANIFTLAWMGEAIGVFGVFAIIYTGATMLVERMAYFSMKIYRKEKVR